MTTFNNAVLARNCFMNFKQSNTRRIRKSFAKVRAGTGNARGLFWGESNMAGNGSGTGAAFDVDCRKNSSSAQLAKLMNTSVIACHEDSFFGQGPSNASFLGDSRFVLGAGWVSEIPSLGGLSWKNLTTTNPATFTPLNNVDTFKVWFIKGTSGKTTQANVTIDGAAPATGGSTINATGSNTVGTATFTASSSGSHAFAIALNTVDGNGFSILGIEAWDSTRSTVSFINAGAAGNKASNLAVTTNPWSSLTVAAALAPDFLVLLIGQNDATAISNSTGLITDYTTAMTTILNTMTPICDVILGQMGAFDTAIANSASQTAVRQAISAFQVQYDLPFFDPNMMMVDYPTANSDGYMAAQIHENIAGYSQWSGLMLNAFRSMPAI